MFGILNLNIEIYLKLGALDLKFYYPITAYILLHFPAFYNKIKLADFSASFIWN